MSKRTGRINRLLDRHDRWISGHINIGRLTIYGRNAMHYAWNYKRKDGMYVCFRPPSRCFGMRLGWYLYISPDGTPSSATYYRPRKHWPLVEPNDPEYIDLMERKRRA